MKPREARIGAFLTAAVARSGLVTGAAAGDRPEKPCPEPVGTKRLLGVSESRFVLAGYQLKTAKALGLTIPSRC